MSESRITPASSVARRTAPAVAAACALLCGAGALAQERGRLLRVEAGGDAGASSVELIADRPLSFTTLKLTSPPRVVVDLADTELSGAPRDLSIDDGTIRRVAAAPAGQRTARVVIELAAEAEFDVRAEGNRVQVRVPRIAKAAGAVQTPAAAVAAAAPAGSGEPAGSADAPTRLGPPAAQAGATSPATGPLAAESTSPAPADPRTAPAAASGSVPKPAEVAVSNDAHDDAGAAREEARERAAAAERASRERVLAAASKSPAGKPRAVPGRALASASRRSITGIGFRPVGDGEVIVRSDHPLEYGISGEEGAVLLHLPSAAIPLANNRRALDTRFFNGAVQRVVPLAVAGGTDVRIELRGRAEYQLAQSGTVLTVTFSASR